MRTRWTEDDDDDDDDPWWDITPSLKSRHKHPAQSPSPPPARSRGKLARNNTCRPWLDDPSLPDTINEPIVDRLCAFVKTRNPNLRTPEDVSSLAELLMTLMTTWTSRYDTLASLLCYVRMASASDFKKFLRNQVIRKGTPPGTDEEYIEICYAAVATFAAIRV